MDKNIEIILGSTKNVDSVNVDNFEKVELSFKPALIQEYNVRNVLSAAEVFDIERNATPIYRIYGSLEYLSLLNGLKAGYQELSDFFTPQTTGSYKNIFNSFDFYLVKPSSSGYTEIIYTNEIENSTNAYYIINERFIKWNDYVSEFGVYPIGWDVSAASSGAYINKETHQMITQVKFTLNSPDTEVNSSIRLFKDFNPAYGDFIIETYVDGNNLDEETDILSIILYSSTEEIANFNTLVGGIGKKRFTVNVSSYSPITRVEIYARATNKIIYVDYLRIFEQSINKNQTYGWKSYNRQFDIIATPNDFELFKIGFAKNVFNEQRYAFNFNKDIDISSYFDELGFPITEIYLYAKYISTGNEEYTYTYWNEDGVTEQKAISYQNTTEVYGDVIKYVKEQYNQQQLEPQIHYISTPYNGKTLKWSYNPFISLRLQYLSNELSKANTGTTNYDQAISIPIYATKIDNDGNYVWKEILPQGYIDPLTGNGVDYPFINKRRYLFNNLNLTIIPDLTDEHTRNVFNELNIGSTPINIKSIGDINNIGKPCQ